MIATFQEGESEGGCCAREKTGGPLLCGGALLGWRETCAIFSEEFTELSCNVFLPYFFF